MRQFLAKEVERLKKETGLAFRLEKVEGRGKGGALWRITCGGRDLSPTRTIEALCDWAVAYARGWRNAVNHLTKKKEE